jgi:HSP20 family protein
MLRGMTSPTRGYNPLLDMQRAQADLNRMFGTMRFSADDMEISIRRDTITLRGTRKGEPTEDAVVLRQERVTGPFARNFVLPFRVDADKASAKFERGVVTLTLPRPEEDKPHRISIARA